MFPSTSLAHPGNTDSYGCHTCRTNCESWGLSYGEYHCHNSKISNTTPAYQPWSCTIDGQVFYSSSSAQTKWRSMVHSAVDTEYTLFLGRPSNQNDYNYWESKIPFSNCNFYVDPKVIINEVLASDERKQYLARKVATTTTPTSAVIAPATEPTTTQPDYTWIWWVFSGSVVVWLVVNAIRNK